VDPPPYCKPNKTKWVWKNKEGENGEVVRNKSIFVALGYSQKGGIDYEETFALVARLEAIMSLLAFYVAKGFEVPNGCGECLLEWGFGGRGLCYATTRF
jgi:hypothetical protein